MTDPLILCILAPFAATLVAPTVARFLGSRAGWALALVPAAVFVTVFRLLPIEPGEAHTVVVAWAPIWMWAEPLFLIGWLVPVALVVCLILLGVLLAIWQQIYAHRLLRQQQSWL